MNCPICCCIKEEQEFVTKKECQCRYCYKCLIEQIKVNEDEKCLACPREINFIQLFHQTQYEAQFQEIKCLQCLQKLDDVLPCPKAGCNYFGIIPKDCDVNYECEKCKHTWKTKNYSLLNYERTFTQITQFIYTKQCPQCGVLIQKNGGCPQMKCLHCRFTFCWYCDTNVLTHKQLNCNINKYFFLFIGLQLYLTLFKTIGFLDLFTYISTFVFYYLSICVISPLFLVVPIFTFYLYTQKRKLYEIILILITLIPIYYIKEYLDIDLDTILSVTIIDIVISVVIIIKKFKK